MTRQDGGMGHTIGVAIAIPSPFGTVLDQARARFEPASDDMPSHVTIMAPIDVDVDAMPAVRRHLQAVAARTRPFRLLLRGTGTFRPVSPVVFVAVAEGIAACERLERDVRSGDMAVETRFPYHPHVTLAHDVSEGVLDEAFTALAGFTADMQITSMGLYEHLDAGWTLIEELPLTGDTAG